MRFPRLRLLLIAALFAQGPLLASGGGNESALYPRGLTFPIGGYSPKPARDKEAGFTLAGPTYGDSARLLRRCEEAGLDMIYRIKTGLDIKGKRGDAPKTIDRDALRTEIREQVEAVAASERIYAWSVSPEELRYWRPMELEYLRLVTETVKAADPKMRPVWMYEPGHRTAEALGKTLPLMGISAKGMYVNYSQRMDERTWCRWSLRQQAEAIRDTNKQALLFALPEMFRQPPAGRESEIRRWVRHDVYCALLEGAKGILIYSFAHRKRFSSYDDYYHAYAEIARELNGPARLGEVFLAGKPLEPIDFEVAEGPAEVTLSAKPPINEAIGYPSIASRRIAWNGREYLFLVNSAPEAVSILPTSESAGRGWQAADDSRARAWEARKPAPLEAWEVVVLSRSQQPD